MIAETRAKGLIPPEQFADKQCTAEDGSFAKQLVADLSRQKRQPMAIISADAGNCYDRVHHIIMALMFLCIGVPKGNVCAILMSIQLMKFFLSTGWGVSKTFIGGDPNLPMHGLCQGNGAVLASWLLLSSFLVNIYKRMGYGAKMSSPISKIWFDIIFVLRKYSTSRSTIM